MRRVVSKYLIGKVFFTSIIELQREKNNVEKGAQAALIGDVSSQLLSLLNNIEVTPASLDLKDLVAGVECWIIHTNVS